MKGEQLKQYGEMLKAYMDVVDPNLDLEYFKRLLKHIDDDVISFGRRIMNRSDLGYDRHKMFYLGIIISILKGQFKNIKEYFDSIGAPSWLMKEFYNRMKKNNPNVLDTINRYSSRIEDKLAEALQRMVEEGKVKEELVYGILKNKFDLAVESAVNLLNIKELLMKSINEQVPEIVEYYAQDLAQDMTKSIKELVERQIEEMKDELVKTRVLLLKSAMLAVTGYYSSLKERIKKKQVNHNELREAYKIIKTELGEPLSIQEQHNKSLKVVINVPMEQEEEDKNTDLELQIADKFKDIVEAKIAETDSEDIKALQEKQIEQIDNEIVNLELNNDNADQGTDTTKV